MVALVAVTVSFWRVVDAVVDFAAAWASNSAAQAAHDHFIVDDEGDNFIQRHTHVFNHHSQGFCLPKGSGKSIQDEACLPDFFAPQTLTNHFDSDAVGDQLSPVDIAFRQSTKIGLSLNFRAEDDTATDGNHPEPGVEQGSLRAFTYAWGAN